jgi:hypothetical protein
MNHHLKLFAKPFRNWIKQGARDGGAQSVAIAVLLAIVAPQANAESIAQAQYETPTQRYGHFALGQPHEYARLAVTTDTGRRLVLQLPEDEVFEDLTPRLVKLAAEEPVELLTIVSQRQTGARLVLIRLNGDRLELSAESPAVGTPMRWLNPVGVADLDGDGRAELASVTTPHLGGALRVYRREGARLVEIAALDGFSNHVYGSPELGLSAHQTVAEQVRLLVPDNSRRQLRVIGFNSGRLAEVGRCALPAPVTGAIKPLARSEVSVGLATGRHVVVSDECKLPRKPS